MNVALVLIFLLLVLLTLVTIKKRRDMVVATVPTSTSLRRALYRTGGVTDRMRSDRQRRTGMGVMDG